MLSAERCISDDVPKAVILGESCVGLRSCKFTPDEWWKDYAQTHKASQFSRSQSEAVEQHSKDFHNRLNSAILETEFPYMVVTSNINSRRFRTGVDNVADEVEKELVAELKLIGEVQNILKNCLENVDLQISRNRAAKEALEMNWSDKREAELLDSRAGYLTNGSADKQFYPGVALFQENMSVPETWTSEVNEVIRESETQRVASSELRSLTSKILTNTSRDLRAQFDRVNAAFHANIENVTKVREDLENELRKVLDEICQKERNIDEIRSAIRAKDAPLQVAQTRLHTRQFRPNFDLCKDPAACSLVNEVKEIGGYLDVLLEQANQGEQRLKELCDTQMKLEKVLQLKKETIRIDQICCLPKRTYYSSALRLQGFP